MGPDPGFLPRGCGAKVFHLVAPLGGLGWVLIYFFIFVLFAMAYARSMYAVCMQYVYSMHEVCMQYVWCMCLTGFISLIVDVMRGLRELPIADLVV